MAEEQCIIHSRNGRNGVWRPFYNTTHFEMLDRRAGLLGVKPLDLDQLRKGFKTTPHGHSETTAGREESI